MKFPNVNLFAAWFLIIQTLGMAWVSGAGWMLLKLLGVHTNEGEVPGRLIGALLLFAAIYLVLYFYRALPPQGKPDGHGYVLGHRFLLIGNLMAGSLFVFQFVTLLISDHNTHLLLEKFTTAFGYFSIGFFAAGFSFIYQSSLPEEKKI